MQPPPFLQEHLADMRLRGLAEDTTVYARGRVVSRLAAWLELRPLTEVGVEPGAALGGLVPDGGASDLALELPRLTSPVDPVLDSALARAAEKPRADAVSCRRAEHPHGGSVLPDATAADLLAWRRSLTCSPRSIAPYADHVRAYYDYLIRIGYRPDNPAAGLPVPRVRRGLPRPISETDLMAALGTAPARVRPWLVLAGWAALRAKEIALLRRENVHETGPAPFLLIAADATKGHGERRVDMSAFVAAELRAYGLRARGWVFSRLDGQPGALRPALVSKLANEVLHKSGTEATLHQLRHRCLTLAYQESLDLRFVQELAGHVSPQTTAGYAAVSPGKGAAVMNALPVPQRLRVVS